MKIDLLPVSPLPHLELPMQELLLAKISDICLDAFDDCVELVPFTTNLPLLLLLRMKLAFLKDAAHLLQIEKQTPHPTEPDHG